MLGCWERAQESHKRKEAAPQTGCAAVDTYVSCGRWQEGDLSVTGMVLSLSVLFGFVQTPDLTDITDAL